MAPRDPTQLRAKDLPAVTLLRACGVGAGRSLTALEGWPKNLVDAKRRKLQRKGWLSGWRVTHLGLMNLSVLEAGKPERGAHP